MSTDVVVMKAQSGGKVYSSILSVKLDGSLVPVRTTEDDIFCIRDSLHQGLKRFNESIFWLFMNDIL